MAKKAAAKAPVSSPSREKASTLADTRVIYCGENLEQLKKGSQDARG